jgi:nitrogenase-stabilizing/protective protein
MTDATWLNELAELEGAEEFLEYFGITYDPAVVQVNRLHILQRFHDYLEQAGTAMPADVAGQRQRYAEYLQRAYQDFVNSNARTEKVFKVFQQAAEPNTVYIPLDKAFR